MPDRELTIIEGSMEPLECAIEIGYWYMVMVALYRMFGKDGIISYKGTLIAEYEGSIYESSVKDELIYAMRFHTYLTQEESHTILEDVWNSYWKTDDCRVGMHGITSKKMFLGVHLETSLDENYHISEYSLGDTYQNHIIPYYNVGDTIRVGEVECNIKSVMVLTTGVHYYVSTNDYIPQCNLHHTVDVANIRHVPHIPIGTELTLFKRGKFVTYMITGYEIYDNMEIKYMVNFSDVYMMNLDKMISEMELSVNKFDYKMISSLEKKIVKIQKKWDDNNMLIEYLTGLTKVEGYKSRANVIVRFVENAIRTEFTHPNHWEQEIRFVEGKLRSTHKNIIKMKESFQYLLRPEHRNIMSDESST